MCTVSYYKDKDKTVITSNRDENINRLSAIAPQKIIYGGESVFCPIDPQSNGTWFAVTTDGSVFVLLNGANKKHISTNAYRKSRGLILLDIIIGEKFKATWNQIELENIEPFTIVAFVNDELFQVSWNGNVKSLVHLNNRIPHIWSSATLYDDEIIQKRKLWFSNYLIQKQKPIKSEDLISFHLDTQKKDLENGLIINRNQEILTKNVTQCYIEKNRFVLTHLDLISHEKSQIIESIK